MRRISRDLPAIITQLMDRLPLDQRRAERLTISLPLEYEITIQGKPLTGVSHTINVSGTGMEFTIPQMISPGVFCKLQVRLSPQEAPIGFCGQVVRCCQGRRETFHVGVTLIPPTHTADPGFSRYCQFVASALFIRSTSVGAVVASPIKALQSRLRPAYQADKSRAIHGRDASDCSTLLGRLYEAVPDFLQPIEFSVVRTMDELKSASHLVYQEYVKRQYLQPNTSQLRLTLYHALPTTTTFIARHRRAGVIGAISLIQDSPLGLPMDDAYKAEVDALRQQGRRPAEVSMLALDSRVFGRGVFTMFYPKKLLLTLRLFKVMFDYARSCTPIDEIVACFNPKHKMLYDFLHLQPLGELKAYAGANGHPAIARHLNILQTQQQATAAVPYRLFYGAPPSPKPFAKKLQLLPNDLRELFVIQSSLFASASPSELNYLRSCYPAYDFTQILQGSTPPLSAGSTALQP